MNVILHEFAHQLDAENGADDGMPLLASGRLRTEWGEVMTVAFDLLREEDDAGVETFLDPYGAESPAEFFAVITETFFQLPHDLRREHPALYELLERYFQQDPVSWQPEACLDSGEPATVGI